MLRTYLAHHDAPTTLPLPLERTRTVPMHAPSPPTLPPSLFHHTTNLIGHDWIQHTTAWAKQASTRECRLPARRFDHLPTWSPPQLNGTGLSHGELSNDRLGDQHSPDDAIGVVGSAIIDPSISRHRDGMGEGQVEVVLVSHHTPATGVTDGNAQHGSTAYRPDSTHHGYQHFINKAIHPLPLAPGLQQQWKQCPLPSPKSLQGVPQPTASWNARHAPLLCLPRSPTAWEAHSRASAHRLGFTKPRLRYWKPWCGVQGMVSGDGGRRRPRVGHKSAQDCILSTGVYDRGSAQQAPPPHPPPPIPSVRGIGGIIPV